MYIGYAARAAAVLGAVGAWACTTRTLETSRGVSNRGGAPGEIDSIRVADSWHACDYDCWQRRRGTPRRTCVAEGLRWSQGEAAVLRSLHDRFSNERLVVQEGHLVDGEKVWLDLPRVDGEIHVALRVTRETGWVVMRSTGWWSMHCLSIRSSESQDRRAVVEPDVVNMGEY